MTALEMLVMFAGVVQLGILCAAALVPLKLEWRDALAGLPTLTRQLVWVHGSYIVMVIIAFGLLSLLMPRSLASGEPLARAVVGFMGLFWLVRLVLQFAFFDTSGVPLGRVLRAGERLLTVSFAYLAAVYIWAALRA